MFPSALLPISRERRIIAEFPTVALNLHVEALGAVTALVLERKAVIGISGPLEPVERQGKHDEACDDQQRLGPASRLRFRS